MLLRVTFELRAPRRLLLSPPLDAFAEVRERIVGHEERRLGRVSVKFLGQLDLFDAERIAMRGRSALLMRAPIANYRMHANQRRPARLRDSILYRLRQRHEIVRI